MLDRLLRNTIANWLGGVGTALIAFFLTPFIIASLKNPATGNEEYGIWTFIVAATAYVGLADLGIYQGVLQYFTRHRAQAQWLQANSIVSTGFAVLLVASAISLVAAVIVSVFFPGFVEHSGLSAGEIQIAFLLTALGVAARLPLATFNAVIVGCESFHVLNAILIASRLLGAIAMVTVLRLGWGLVGVALASLLANLIELGLKALVSRGLAPELSFGRKHCSREALATIAGYGRWMFASRVSNMYLVNVDLVVVPLLFGAEAAAVYALALTLAKYAQVPLKGFAFVMIPAAITADARAAPDRLQTILLTGSRFGFMVAGLFFVGFLFWGEEFIYQWIGDASFLWDAKYLSAATVLGIVSVDRVLLAGLAGPQQVLIGMRRVRTLALVNIAMGAVGLAGAVVAGKVYGLIGVPVAMLVAESSRRILLSVYACRATGVTVGRYLRESIVRPLAAILLTASACVIIAYLVEPGSWTRILLKVCLTSLVALGANLALCFSAEERRRLAAAARNLLRRRDKAAASSDRERIQPR